MDVGILCSLGSRSGSWSRGYGEGETENERFVSLNYLPRAAVMSRPKANIWRLMWRKIKKQKKRFFVGSPIHARYSYDPCSYAQNFDRGLIWAEADPDDLSRSFSARFAVPSSIFEKNKIML